MASEKPIVLHLGDPVEFNKELYAQIENAFTVIRPSLEERQRNEFLKALQEKRWGDFQAIFRPFWNSGGEMGRWDAELIPLLPSSLKVYASAGAGYDWMDVDILAEHGELDTDCSSNTGSLADDLNIDIVYCNGAQASSEAVADMVKSTARNNFFFKAYALTTGNFSHHICLSQHAVVHGWRSFRRSYALA
jgi:lactate dehydrogenase-like 2-hydroxyacid dehydrogenase